LISSAQRLHQYLHLPALFLLGGLCTQPCGSAQEPDSAAQGLTLEQASGRATAPSFSARAQSVRWAHDGRHVLLGRDEDARWLDPVTLLESEPVPRPKVEREEEEPDRISTTKLKRSLTEEFGALELLALSADSSVAGFVQDNDLFVFTVGNGKLVRVTDTGTPEFLNGKLDWVYQEEVYGRGRFKGFWLSPKGRYVAFLALDESAVHSFTLVDHIEDGTHRVRAEEVNYPKAGDPNPVTALGIADTKTGKVRWADLSSYEGQEPLVVRVDWTPAGICHYMVQDRIQSTCDLRAYNPRKGSDRLLIHEESDSWVNRPPPARWVGDKTFLWESERTGYNHLYRYRPDGKLLGAVTQGEWAVRGVTHVDEEAEWVTFDATMDGAVNRNTYSTSLNGGEVTRLTAGLGSHSLSFSEDRQYFLDRVSSLEQPEEMRLCSVTGEVLKVLDQASIPAVDGGPELAMWKLHEVQSRDGTALDVALMLPVPFDETRPHAVFIDTYSGPDSPSVSNRWSMSAWDQFRAQQGIILMRVNVRTASGKGQWAIGQCYRRLGVMELSDMEDCVDWLCANPWANGERVGITGYSYGGFMSAYALLASDRFALGIAGGGVYDWGLYDTIYTERYMATPQGNAEGYKETSCLERAGDLHGYLHMHHGVMDDNVHFQNMMKMAYALQRAGQTEWSMMAYPQARHGIRDKEQRWHARQTEWRLIEEHLLH
jgi:dipeptidyl-peptidase-4